MKDSTEMKDSTFECLVICCDMIEAHAKRPKPEEGILRVSGRHASWKATIEKIQDSPDHARSILAGSPIHDVSSIFKELLRDVQDQCGTLLTKKCYHQFKEAKSVQQAKEAVEKLPTKNRAVLRKVVAKILNFSVIKRLFFRWLRCCLWYVLLLVLE